jgi:CO/xanthine dehydrogenase Mo-binding subunit
LQIVVTETAEQARAAARLVEIEYAAMAPIVAMDDSRAPVLTTPWGMEMQRGDAAAGLASADVVSDGTFTIVPETNNPLGLFATVPAWDGARLTVHDSTQWPMLVRTTLTTMFGIPEPDVRVRVPYLGGDFGAGLRVWPHTILVALAARVVERSVKLVLNMGIGMALLEETSFDRTGRIANATLADYLIPANADVPEIEVVFVGERDRFNPIGSKGLGEIGLMGVAAAIANAVYHATGKRIRSLPITLDKLL